MKLDVNVLRYLSKDDFRVLTAVEMGMRNVSAIYSLFILDLNFMVFVFTILPFFFLKILCYLCLQHEIVPSELVERIASLKYASS